MERLTERDSHGDVYVKQHDYVKASERLADYEDAEENGLLLRLPCKIGDTVYTACAWGIESGVVGAIDIISDMIFVRDVVGALIGDVKNVFLTREEAEKALSERSGE